MKGKNMNKVNVRLAKREDYPHILALESSNYIDNLQDIQRKDGFLSAKMSEEQVDAIAKDLGIAVACAGEELIGFFCVSRPEHWPPDSIVHRLVHYLKTDLRDKRMADPQSFCIFGPMCLAPSARGKGLLEKLYEHANANLGGRFAAAAGFICTENPRSLGAMAKLDWQPTGRFQWGTREYHALIRDIARSSRVTKTMSTNA
ncbi:MAG TPA: hypothetical protein VNV88_15350 [Candidatus Solibacter sp.]|nr:hypothetical protein [Candidatus Solibacter sp.]